MGAYFSKLSKALPEPDSLHSNINTRAELVSYIKGSHVKIPDLQSLFTHWPQDVHPQVGKLDDYVQRTLESIFPGPEEEDRLRKMKATEVALFAASWWAYAPFEMLCVATTLSIWLFVWDDELDSAEFSSLIEDFSSASKFRQETLKFLRLSLSKNRPQEISAMTDSRIIKSFEPVGNALAACYNERQIDTFVKELTLFIDMCQEEHNFQMTANLPTIEEYLKRRMGSSAVRVAQSQADTLVPLLFLKRKSVQAAIDEAAAIISKSIERFEAAEDEVLSLYSSAPDIQDMIKHHVKACKLACTANLNWSLVSGRYQLRVTSTSNGIDLVL